MRNHLLDEKIKEYNRNSTSLIFNEADLVKQEEKFKISSPELQNLLNSLIGNNVDAIIFLNQPSSFLKKQRTCPNFRWIMVKKENISEKVRDEILYLLNNDYNLISGWTNLNFLTDDETWKKIKEAEIEKDEINEKFASLCREINTEIELNEICRGDLEGFYVVNLPTDCGCEIVPNSSGLLYLNHMRNCCSDFSEVVNFQKDLIKAIPEVKRQLNNFKRVFIKEVEDEMKKKRVSEEDGERLLPNWKNKLTLLRSVKDLEEKRDLFLKKIRDFSEVSNEEGRERVREETRIQTEELEKEQTENRNKERQRQQESNEGGQNNNNPFPDKEEKDLKNPLPSPAEIQNQYDSDKDKAAIDNNSDLTEASEKQAAQELLKLVIVAELLVKENKFNSAILNKLSQEKQQNTPIYQLLNKEKRIDQVVDKLESIKQSQNSNKSLVKDKDNKQIPAGIIWAISGGMLILLVLGVAIVVKRKRRKRKSSR